MMWNGLSCLRSREYFILKNSFQGIGCIGPEGAWNEGGQSVIFVNVYSPWEELKSLKVNSTCDNWCILGDLENALVLLDVVE